MRKEVQPKCELSCLIGNLFATVEPPCSAEYTGDIVISGTTRSGNEALLVITGDAFFFSGNPDDLAAASQSCPHKSSCPLYQREGGLHA